MNLNQFFDSSNFVAGLFELDGDGKVLYSRFKSRAQLMDLTNHLAGQNFFGDGFKFENSDDFQYKLRNFVSSRQFTDNFVFDCQLDGKTIPVRIMLIRASETNQLKVRDILIVDIRKNDC